MITNIPLNALRPNRWERIEGDSFYIGSTCVGTLEGSRETGYIIRPSNGGNAYSPNLTRAFRILRNSYWYRVLTNVYMGLI
jgi:hypothetical protein